MPLAAEMMGDPTRKDAVVAILGASAALGGFVLVFLGLLLNGFQALAGDSPRTLRDAWRRRAYAVLGVFGLTVATIALALIWLAVPGGTCLYRAVLAVFAAELAAIVAVATLTGWRLLR